MKKTNQKPNLPFQTVEVMDQINVESKSGEESKTLDHEIVDCSKDEDQKNKIQESEVQILEVKENHVDEEESKIPVETKKYTDHMATISDAEHEIDESENSETRIHAATDINKQYLEMLKETSIALGNSIPPKCDTNDEEHGANNAVDNQESNMQGSAQEAIKEHPSESSSLVTENLSSSAKINEGYDSENIPKNQPDHKKSLVNIKILKL